MRQALRAYLAPSIIFADICSYNIISSLVVLGCTELVQPLNVSVNRSFKSLLCDTLDSHLDQYQNSNHYNLCCSKWVGLLTINHYSICRILDNRLNTYISIPAAHETELVVPSTYYLSYIV